MSSSFYEEEEKMKKKSSLKELLQNKKANIVPYKVNTDTKNSIVKKSAKDYDFCSSSKENRNFYGKFF